MSLIEKLKKNEDIEELQKVEAYRDNDNNNEDKEIISL